MKGRIIGKLQRHVQKRIRLRTMTEKHKKFANDIFESLHRAPTDVGKHGPLPKRCSRENKNRYLLVYVVFLVQWKLLNEMLVSFLPIGHTHENIDQSFSVT